MDKKFILTQDAETYDALKRLGFTDMGRVIGMNDSFVLGNSDTLQVPDALKKSCLFTNKMFFVADRKGGESIEQRQ